LTCGPEANRSARPSRQAVMRWSALPERRHRRLPFRFTKKNPCSIRRSKGMEPVAAVGGGSLWVLSTTSPSGFPSSKLDRGRNDSPGRMGVRGYCVDRSCEVSTDSCLSLVDRRRPAMARRGQHEYRARRLALHRLRFVPARIEPIRDHDRRRRHTSGWPR
jgi:hypothetical protein